MKHSDLLNKTCLIGISYFDSQENLLHQRQHSGTVIEVDLEEGISIKLDALKDAAGEVVESKNSGDKPAILHLPPSLQAWFIAPQGHFRQPEFGINIENPDYLVTWDVYKTKDDTPEGKHEWWEWVPRTSEPQVNQPSGKSN